MSDGLLSRLAAMLACGLVIVPAVANEGQVASTSPRPLEQTATAAAPTGLIFGQVIDATTMAFKEDLVVAEGIQERVNGGVLPRQVLLRIDAGAAQAHRMLDRMLAAEKEEKLWQRQ